ncbi:MAG TPA: PH domain-containing protein [Mycobacteriales bacterium]|nr:PH domain-containing protein [Mycobacteriales bacterium]
MDLQWRSPSPRMWSARRLEVGGLTAAGLLAGGLIAGFVGGMLAIVIVLLVVLVVGGWFAFLNWRRYRAWGYAEREDDLLVRRGVMFRRLTVVPYGRMQFVDVTAGPVDRLFGLATVQLHTAAAATDARIPGLERDEATRLRDRLAALGEARAAGL